MPHLTVLANNATCRVVELIPPAVATALAGPGNAHGTPLDDFCDAVCPGLRAGEADEIGYRITDGPAVRDQIAATAALFAGFAGRFPVATY